MKLLALASALFFIALGIARAQAPALASPPNPDGAKPGQTQPNTAPQTGKPKKKKVWTNDEISTVGGPGGISVVGNANDANATRPDTPHHPGTKGTAALQQRQIAIYRDQLRQLNNQLEATDKQISELRNFKATNTSASGGINMNRRYSMTPVEDQVKNLEDKKKQLQAQISAVEDQARKEGVEPGLLR